MRHSRKVFAGGLLLALGWIGGCRSTSGTKGSGLFTENVSSGAGSQLLSNADGSLAKWSGVGRFRGALSCTAFWLKTSERADAPVYALSNGHCAQEFTAREGSDTVYTNRAVTEPWTVSFGYFFDTIAQQKTVKVKQIVYSTMKRRDLAILELDATQGELLAAGVQPLTLARTIPELEADIRVLGVPLLPVAEEQLYLREHLCREQGATDVVEWFWFWSQLRRNSCADIVPGSSGSPVLNAQGEVYAVINTTTRDGNSRSCYMGNPCEISSEGAVRRDDKNYAVALSGLESCWNASGVWDLSQPACPLDRRSALGVQSTTLIPNNGKDRTGEALRWNLQVTHPKPETLRYKRGLAGQVFCEDPKGYKVFKGATDPNFSGVLPAEEGVYLVCFAEAADLSAKRVANPSTLVFTIDKTPPEGEPFINIIDAGDSVTVEPIFAVPEYSFFRIAYGPLASTDCSKAEFFPYRRFPTRVNYEELPVRYCVQGDDHAGNQGRIIERVIQRPETAKKR